MSRSQQAGAEDSQSSSLGRGVLDGSTACHLRRDSGQVPEVYLIAWPQIFYTCGLRGIPAGAYTNNPRFIGSICRNLDPFGFKMGRDSLGPCSLDGEGVKQEEGSLSFPSWGPQKRTQPPCSAVRASCEHLLPERPSDCIVSYFQRWQRPSRPTTCALIQSLVNTTPFLLAYMEPQSHKPLCLGLHLGT